MIPGGRRPLPASSTSGTGIRYVARRLRSSRSWRPRKMFLGGRRPLPASSTSGTGIRYKMVRRSRKGRTWGP
jgi:hypothetical protein